jgi:hypothetical protein
MPSRRLLPLILLTLIIIALEYAVVRDPAKPPSKEVEDVDALSLRSSRPK